MFVAPSAGVWTQPHFWRHNWHSTHTGSISLAEAGYSHLEYRFNINISLQHKCGKQQWFVYVYPLYCGVLHFLLIMHEYIAEYSIHKGCPSSIHPSKWSAPFFWTVASVSIPAAVAQIIFLRMSGRNTQYIGCKFENILSDSKGFELMSAVWLWL